MIGVLETVIDSGVRYRFSDISGRTLTLDKVSDFEKIWHKSR